MNNFTVIRYMKSDYYITERNNYIPRTSSYNIPLTKNYDLPSSRNRKGICQDHTRVNHLY